jgi:hypothetical protein
VADLVGRDRAEGGNIDVSTSAETIEIQVPSGYVASVLLKRLGHEGGNIAFAIWAVAGRYRNDAARLSYQRSEGDSFIQVNVPEGNFSIEYIYEHLRAAVHRLSSKGGQPEETPIIIGTSFGRT